MCILYNLKIPAQVKICQKIQKYISHDKEYKSLNFYSIAARNGRNVNVFVFKRLFHEIFQQAAKDDLWQRKMRGQDTVRLLEEKDVRVSGGSLK